MHAPHEGAILKKLVYALLVVLTSCSTTQPLVEATTTTTNRTTTTLAELVEGVNAYSRGEPYDKPTDGNGIHVYERDGVRYRHPVAQTQYALSLVEAFFATGNREWLAAAEANAQDLIDNASPEGILEYWFDFPLHGDPDNTIHAPWRSAMAQGQFLSLTTRLWQATDDPYWRVAADETFETLLDQDTDQWVTFTDEEGYVWLEEYAGDVEPMRVLNGHVFAMYGLYDYHHATGSVEALELFYAAGETVLRYMPQLRVPDDVSWYGIRIQDNPIAQSASYHAIHIRQLDTLALMTGNPEYAEWARLLEADFSG